MQLRRELAGHLLENTSVGPLAGDNFYTLLS